MHKPELPSVSKTVLFLPRKVSKYRPELKHPPGVISEVIASKWEAFETSRLSWQVNSTVVCFAGVCWLITALWHMKALVVGLVQLWRKESKARWLCQLFWDSGDWGRGRYFSLWQSPHRNRSPSQPSSPGSVPGGLVPAGCGERTASDLVCQRKQVLC